MKLAQGAYDKADFLGRLFILNGEELPQTKIQSTFSGDAKIYNIIYDRAYKDRKNKDQNERKSLFPEREIGIFPMSTPNNRETLGVQYSYGLADNRVTPVIIASKNIPPKEGDKINVGGKITAIVFAEIDNTFETVLKKTPQAEKKGP